MSLKGDPTTLNRITVKSVLAVVFSVLMITSVFVGSIAFTGTAAAALGDVPYRVNTGGPQYTAADGTVFEADSANAYFDGGGPYSNGQLGDGDIASTGDDTLYLTERSGKGGFDYAFPVADGTYTVKLHLAEIYFGATGGGPSGENQRVFDANIEGGDVELDDYDINAEVGPQTAVVKSYDVEVTDGELNIAFSASTNQPKVSAIEVLTSEPEPNTLGGPSSVDFGTVVTGNSGTEQVSVRNLGGDGDSDITLNDASISGSDASDFSTDFSGSVTLAPGESADISITFTPSDAQAKDATLQVSHSGSNSPLTVDLSGGGSSTVPVGFQKSTLQGFSAGAPTAIEMGPDDRVYVSTQGGTVYALNVTRTGENSYDVNNEVQIDAIKDIPNHDDNGNYDPGETNRQITGLTVGGTADEPILYVSSSDPDTAVGDNNDDTDTNSGTISRLTISPGDDGVLQQSEIKHDVMVMGLPRSEENHATNGLDLSADGNTLYVAQGGNTNKGAPSNNFGHTPEFALSGAILEIDLAQIEANYQPKNLGSYDPQGSSQSYADLDFYYAIPTIQNDDATDGDDLPFGGDDGVNMAKIVDGGPVQVYSPGYRNPYDLVLTEGGQIYAADHGPNGGWGGQPADANGNIVTDAASVTNHPNEDGSYSTNDQLVKVDEGDYGGHGNPVRANPTGADVYDANGDQIFDITAANSPVPTDMVDPRQADYIPPTSHSPNPGAPAGSANTMRDENGNVVTLGPTGAIDEYTASNFGGAMQGNLLQTELGGSIERVQLSADGSTVTDIGAIFNANGPLGLDAVGDDGAFPGTVWTADHGSAGVTVFEPADYGGNGGGGEQCTGADDPSLDEDGDGYDNADEIDAGTKPCSSASTPADFDNDGTSNVNDNDDDNDGASDSVDPFAVDADNGTSTTLPVRMGLTELKLFDETGQGWTGLMTNGQDDYQSLYDPDQMTVGGAAEVLTVENVPKGDATNNDQQFAFQRGIDAPDQPFTVSTTVNGLPESPTDYQGLGIYVGTGDQDNYVKLIAAANTGSGGVQFAKETGGTFTNIKQPDDSNVTGPGTNTNLSMTVDPTTDPNPNNGQEEVAITAEYTVGGETTAVGTGAMPASWLDSSDGSGLAVGVISTSYGASSTFDATWTHLDVEYVTPPANQPPTADAGSGLTVEEGQQVTLDGSGSSDSNGDQLGYTWTQTAGNPSVQPLPADGVKPTFTAPEVDGDQTLTFQVSVSDGQTFDTDTVDVTVQDTDSGTPTDGEVVYRVNAGGQEVDATGNGPNWTADTSGSASPYLVAGGKTSGGYSAGSVDSSVPDGTPTELFQTERYDGETAPEMQWEFSAQQGATYEVRLYFHDGYAGTSAVGDRVFNVSIEDEQVLSNFDIIETYGDDTAAMESFEVTPADDTIDIEFLHGMAENPQVNAIEIVKTGSSGGSNTAPTIDAISDQTVTEGDSATVQVNTSDVDGDTSSLSLDSAPSFVTLVDSGDGNGTLTIEPGTGDAGSYQFDVVADDGQATANETVNLAVEKPSTTQSYDVETGMATDVAIDKSTATNAKATLNGTLSLGDKSEAQTYVRFWVQGQPETMYWYSGETLTESGTFDISVVLSPSTTYEWQALSKSGDGAWKVGDAQTFTTPTGEFFGVTSGSATNVGVESATLNGEIVNLGDNTDAQVYFTYWKQGQKDSTLTWYTGPVKNAEGTFSTEVGLDPGTTYEFRAFGQSNEGEWKAGAVETFTTQTGQSYAVQTDPATDIGSDSATLNGNLTGLGDKDDAQVYFTYWKQGQKDSTLTWWTGNTKTTPGEFNATVALDSETTYEFQAYSQSNDGNWKAGGVTELTTTKASGGDTNEAPSVSFTTSGSPTVGENVTFDASNSGDSDGTIESYEWGFGDDSAGSGEVVNHTYGSAGEYTVTLTVTDNESATNSTQQTVIVADSSSDTTASALVEITPDSSNIAQTTYGTGSYQVTNTGEKNISSVSFDLSTAWFPDMVFDPQGTAGDPTGEGFNIANEGDTSITTAETSGGDYSAFSQPHNGQNAGDGYDVMTVKFDDFQNGEQATFWADNDPTSIKNASIGSQEAGPVSGLELARSTVTVTYEDGTTQTAQLMGDGSVGGSTAILNGSEAPAPALGIEGTSLDSNALRDYHSAATVADASQTVTVTGQPGETVTLVHAEGELTLTNVPDEDNDGEPGYDLESYEANNAQTVEYHTVTLNDNGEATVPVTLLNVTDDGNGDGGYNYFVAAHGEASGDMGLASNVVVLKYVENAGGSNTAPTIDAISDQSVTESESVTVPVTTSDADGDSVSLSVNGPTFVSLANGDLTIAPESGDTADSPYTVDIVADDGTDQTTESFNLTVEEASSGGGDETVFAVNAGGSEYTAADGTTYQADTNFDGGSTSEISQWTGSSDTEIGNTDDDPLYRTERYGGKPGSAPFSYNTPVENGTYEVTLKFAEIYQGVADSDSAGGGDGTNAGDRVFSANIEGGDVELSGYDIFADVGPLNATEKTYTVDVADGELNVEFSASADNAKISAIKVTKAGDGSGGDSNTAPSIQSISDQTVTESDSTTVPVSATDDDGDSLSLSKTSGPAFVTLTDDGDGTGTFDIAPQSGDAGSYTVEVTADDGIDQTTQTFTITVEEPSSGGIGSADFAVNTNSGIDASTYGGGSLEITNTGDKQITSVTYDLSSATLPDVVFDPAGNAGDSTGKDFTPDSGSSATGLQGGSFATPHNGQNADDGYDELTTTFDDFENGESFAFSTDIDPTSIKDAQGSGFAGSVSGLELSGATVTVEYADGSTQTTNLFGDGSDGGSQATAKADPADAPTLGVSGVSLDTSALDDQHGAATVSSASQTITVSGPAGATVELLQVEGQLELANQANGYEIEEYEANTAEQVSYRSVQLDTNGEATIDVTLTNTSSDGAEGGFNHFIAAVEDGNGDTGATSNTVVLKLDESSGSSSSQVLHRVNVGESTTVPATDDGPDWTGVTGTSSQYLASADPDGDNYCGGDDVTPNSTVPESTPDGVFACERYGNSTWEFSVDSGEDVEARLYFANSFPGASEPGDRKFNVSIEGQQVLAQYDPVADVGHANGTMKRFAVTDDGDGTITVVFDKGAVENPEVRAIEIVETEQ